MGDNNLTSNAAAHSWSLGQPRMLILVSGFDRKLAKVPRIPLTLGQTHLLMLSVLRADYIQITFPPHDRTSITKKLD